MQSEPDDRKGGRTNIHYNCEVLSEVETKRKVLLELLKRDRRYNLNIERKMEECDVKARRK
jgi:hypothetical protein